MAKKPVTTRFEQDEIQQLDALADKNGLGRSPQIAAIVRDYLAGKSAIHKGTGELARLNGRLDELATQLSTVVSDIALLRSQHKQHISANHKDLAGILNALATLQNNIATVYGGLLHSKAGQPPQETIDRVKQEIYNPKI